MTKTITASQFCQEMLCATKKQLINNHKTELKCDNFFYYSPSIFSFVTLNGIDVEKGLVKIYNYFQSHPNAIKMPAKLYEPINWQIKVDPNSNVPKAWSLNIDTHLFDENAHVIADYSINNFVFGTPLPNHSYIIPYISNGNKRYYGIMIPYPNLDAQHSYSLEIIEHYTLRTADGDAHFTRKIILPINVGKTDNKHFARLSNSHNPNFEFYNRKKEDWKLVFSDLNAKIDWRKDYGSSINPQEIIGLQSILIGRDLTPRLLMNNGYIMPPLILTDYYGTKRELYNSFMNYAHETHGMSKPKAEALAKLFIGKLSSPSDPLSNAFIASLINGKTTKDPELNHNNLGCSNFNLTSPFFADEPKHHALWNERPYHINSSYEFEELLPAVTVNEIKEAL